MRPTLMEYVSWSAQWVWYTSLPVGFPGAFDCRLHLACSVSHAGRNTQSLAYWSGMEPQGTTFRRRIYLGPFPQQRTPGRSRRQERRYPSPHPNSVLFKEKDGISCNIYRRWCFFSMRRRCGDIPWNVFPCWCTSTNLFSKDSPSPSLLSTHTQAPCKGRAKAWERKHTVIAVTQWLDELACSPTHVQLPERLPL